jgi:uracil-DNA glycosylase
MLVFGASMLIGWVMMVLLPLMSGGPPLANLGILTVTTVASLLAWRVGGGQGWGMVPVSDASDTAVEAEASGPNASARISQTSLLPPDWSAVLERRGLSSTRLDGIVQGALASSGTREVFPDRADIFRAFWLTPLSDVRVVILGQDPFFRRGEADGLAFSVRKGVEVPHSLSRIFSNLEADPDITFSRPSDGDLTRWAQSGVLLLNSALTVEEGLPGSHSRHWGSFADCVLRALNDMEEPVVFLLWGDDANDKADAIPIDRSRHWMIMSTHPRQERDSRFPRFADTRPFSEANRFLRARGRPAVDWRL